MNNVLQDWRVNKNNIKGRVVLLLFRIAHLATLNKVFFFLLLPHLIFYRLCIEWVLGVELPYKLSIGKNLILYHGQATVLNDNVKIGSNCILRHCITIGNKILPDGSFSKCPTIGDNVEIGANVCIIGDIKIGNNVIVAAGSMVIRDVPDNCMVAGNPAIIKRYFNCP
ncbi:MAG: serine acetyltransferase [Flavobacterium sp.]|nr:MAG: serine acetyltransferase [Flavobacterium sp.]